MSRVDPDHLKALAAEALYEAYKEAENGPIAQTKQLRFLLAYIAAVTEQNGCANFWREATRSPGGLAYQQFGRRQTLSNAFGFTIRQMGFEPPD